MPAETTILAASDYECHLGLDSGDSDVAILHRQVESAIKDFLRYDPVQATRTKFYPQRIYGQLPRSRWHWELQDTNAVLRNVGAVGRTASILQLDDLPLRGGTDPQVWEDPDGRYGSPSGSFPSSTELTYGTDFWADWDYEDGDSNPISFAGALLRDSAWTREPGSIKVTAVTGYSYNEFKGTADSQVDEATRISRACLLLMGKAYETTLTQRRGVDPVTPSPSFVVSERMGDYSYQGDASTMRQISGLHQLITGEIAELLSSLRHYGQRPK